MQDNPFADLIPNAAAPQASAAPRMIVPPRVKQPAPYEIERDQRQDMREDRRDQRSEAQFQATQGNQAFDNVAKLRTEFNSRKEVVDYTTVLPQIADAMKIAKNPNATGADDLSLIYTFGKVMDPGSVVREGELALASGTGSFAQNLEGAISKLQNGQKLPPEVRMNLVRAMQRRGVELARNYNRQRDNYRGMAERGRFNPDDVIGIHPGGDFQQIEADFLGQPIRNRDGSMGAMPAGAAQSGQPPIGFDAGGQEPQAPQGGPQLPPPDERGYVFPPANPNLTEEQATALRVQGQQMIRDGASYDDVARFFYSNGLGFNAPALKEATQAKNGVVVEGIADLASAGRGLLKGITHPIDRAAQGLESGVNALLGTDFNSAEQANAERDAYFAANRYDQGAETIGNIASTAAGTWRMGPWLGGAVGNVLAGDSDTGSEVTRDAVIGGLAGKAADLTLRGGASLIAPKVNPAAQRLANEGVELTPGQLGARRSLGRRTEERATSLPGGGGGAIEAARDRSIVSFNRANANRALKSVGKAVPRSVEDGNATVKFVEETLSNEYDSLLSKVQVSLDMGWAGRVAAIRRKYNLPDAEAQQFDEIIAREVQATFGRNPNGMAVANGRAFKKFDEKLGAVAAQFEQAQGQPYVRDLGKAIKEVAEQTYGQLRKQNPKVAARLAKVDEGWAQYARIRAAASQTMDGIYSPGQFRNAVRQSDRSLKKGAVAKGDALMQDMARDASEVLPSTLANSGTADRGMVLDPRAWALGMVAERAYQPGVTNALAQFATKPRGPAANFAADILRQLPGGSAGGLFIPPLFTSSPR